MLRCILIVGLFGLLVVPPVSAENFSGKVTPSRNFVLELTLFGSLELLLDASWTKKAPDLDWLVECDYVDGTFTAAQSQSTERRLEDLQAGFSGGDGLVCRAILYSFKGSSKMSVNFRTTGTEFIAAPAAVRVVDGDEVPGLRERISESRARKRRLMPKRIRQD